MKTKSLVKIGTNRSVKHIVNKKECDYCKLMKK